MMGAMQMFSYARRLAKLRRANPGEDVFSLIALAEEDGEQLDDIDLGATFIVLATAGNETTRTLSIDVRATLETDDGATIFVSYQGRSDYTKAGAAPIITAPLFETSDPRYLWLNKVQAIARGRAEGMSKLVYDIYEVQ